MLMFLLFTTFSLHLVLIIPGCMLMFTVGKGSPGVLNSIQQKFHFEILLIGTLYIPAAQTQPKPQRVIVLVCRLQKSNTGDNTFVK